MNDKSRKQKAESRKIEPQVQRLFLAISLPETIKDEMEKAQDELRCALPGEGVRWTRREQFHLTLKFLGNVPVDRTAGLIHAVREAAGSFPALRLRAERIGFFPHLRSPRVIWAWVHDPEDFLPRLQSALESAVSAFTTEAVEEHFTGHVTLGRVKHLNRSQAEMLAKRALAMTERCFGEWAAGSVEIIRSERSYGGTAYSQLAKIILGRA